MVEYNAKQAKPEDRLIVLLASNEPVGRLH